MKAVNKAIESEVSVTPAQAEVSAPKNKTVTGKVSLVNGTDLKKNLSMKYNCRSPSRHSKAYLSMRDTAREAPELFVALNGGIVVAGDYILDGGHTYLALTDAFKAQEVNPADISVRITDLGNLSADEMIMRSVALNRRVTPPLMGERDLKGDWDKLKSHLGKSVKLFEFRPNTNPEAHYQVGFLVALLNAWSTKSADKSYSSKGNLIRLYTDDKYATVLPLLPKMLDVYSFIYEMLISDEKTVKKLAGYNPNKLVTLPNGTEIMGYLPEAFLWPIFGAVHALINEEGELTKDPITVITKKRAAIVKQLLADYKKSGSGPAKYGKDSAYYLNMAIAILGA